MAMEKMGVKLVKNPPDCVLHQLGVKSWPKWTGSPSEFPWTFKTKETMYLMKGRVKVYPDSLKEEVFEIGGGDLVEFPAGLSCFWEIIEDVEKHYNLGAREEVYYVGCGVKEKLLEMKQCFRKF